MGKIAGLDFFVNVEFEVCLICSLAFVSFKRKKTLEDTKSQFHVIMPNYISLTMVIEVTDYKDTFLVVMKRNILILIVDKLNTPGVWHLKFQLEEETKYV